MNRFGTGALLVVMASFAHSESLLQSASRLSEHRVNPYAKELTNIRAGAKLFRRDCSQCHGDNLQNNSGVAFDLRRLRANEHSRFIDAVLHGKRAMPSWEGALSSEQIENIWAYVRANAYDQ